MTGRELGTIYGSPPYTVVANGAINRGHGVNRDATTVGEGEEADAAGQAIDGVATATVADGESVAILDNGQYGEAICGAALGTLETDLAMDASGRFVAAVTGDVVVGQNLTTTGAAGEKFAVKLDLSGNVVPA